MVIFKCSYGKLINHLWEYFLTLFSSFLSLFIVSQWVLLKILSSNIVFHPQPPLFGIEFFFLIVSLFLMSSFGSGYFSWFLLCSICGVQNAVMLTSCLRTQTDFSFLSQECFSLFWKACPSYHKSVSPSLCETGAQNTLFPTSPPNHLTSAFCGFRPWDIYSHNQPSQFKVSIHVKGHSGWSYKNKGRKMRAGRYLNTLLPFFFNISSSHIFL